jgi:hypothetical protein
MIIRYSDKTTPPENSITPVGDVEILDLVDQELVSKLDSLKSNGNIYKKYSEIYSGGIYALTEKSRAENPDWMSQSANSFREILYVLKTIENNDLRIIIKKYFMRSLTEKEVINYGDYLVNLYSLFTDLTHHFSYVADLGAKIYQIGKGLIIRASELDHNTYIKAISLYKEYLKLLVITAIEMHKRIDDCINENNKNKKLVRRLLSNSFDSKTYFFSKADEHWLHWLWTKGFFVELKKPAADLHKYSYRMPELEYLMRMTEKEPEEVANIIRSIRISKTNLNPEVIDRFLWIISALPAEQIRTLTAKVRDENWVGLMKGFRKTGYEFNTIIRKLRDERENGAILELARAILAIKTKEDISEERKRIGREESFYVSDLDASGIFAALADIEESYAEKALQIVAEIVSEIVKLGETDESKAFEYKDLFHFFNVDIFTLELEKDRSHTYNEDVKSLIATLKKLVERTFGNRRDDSNEAKRLFGYLKRIPTCYLMWRIRLYALTQSPEALKEELKTALYRLFEVDNYRDIVGGTEYKKALKSAFYCLPDSDRRTYVNNVINYFSKKEKQNTDQEWHRRIGWEILSSIYKYLKEDELQRCEQVFGKKCSDKYEPRPLVGEIKVGFVSHQPPADLKEYTIEQIADNLKSEWTPETLSEQFKNDDFLSPRGYEGLGDALKEDIKKRKDDYLSNINRFFDRRAIHPHYLYSLLLGIEEMYRNKQELSAKQIAHLIGLFDTIISEGQETPFKKTDVHSWLVDWIAVHKVISDILLYILNEKETKVAVINTYRERIKNLISYLLSIKNSPSKDDEEPGYGDPYFMAINSVRGRAYEAFVQFVENDGELLAEDVKELFKTVLMDDSLAVRFVIGRYLASFYFRDKEFITSLFPAIFPKDDPDKKDIYLATWEGYLSNTLYDRLYVALNDYYRHAIKLDPKDYTQREYSKSLDEYIAIHLALAFVHLGVEIGDSLIAQFWDFPIPARHHEFISFIGRSCLTRKDVNDDRLKENGISKEKLINFWDWALENVSEPGALSGFGLWINPDKEVLDDRVVVERIAQTLKKTDGDISWDYGLLKRLPFLADKNGEKTLEILSCYLLDSSGNINQHRRLPLLYQDEIREALKVTYKTGDDTIKQRVTRLINVLIEKGSSSFWYLKKIVD